MVNLIILYSLRRVDTQTKSINLTDLIVNAGMRTPIYRTLLWDIEKTFYKDDSIKSRAIPRWGFHGQTSSNQA